MASVLLSRRINPTTAPLLHRAATRSCRLASFKTADPSRPISVPGEKLLEFFSEEFEVGSQKTRIETGLLARFSNGAAVFNVGDTHVLSAVACRQADATQKDFLPLTVEYQEKQYAQGVIPTTFLRREGAPRERELLCGRLIDRPIRPLFPKGFYHDVQVTVNVLASDRMQDPDVMAVNATSAALMLSDIPWDGPIGVVRLGRVEGRFVINPSMDELSRSDLNLVYACTRDRTLMIDGQAREITESDLTAGLHVAHLEAARYIEPQIRLAEKAGKRKKDYTLSMFTQRTLEKVEGMTGGPIEDVFTDPKYGKFDRGEALDKITQNAKAILEKECDEESLKFLPKVVDMVRKKVVRKRIIEKGLRVDGRQLDEVRGLHGMHGVYSALHGSSLFRRGETQVFCTVTLGTPGDAQRLDSLVGPPTKRFMLHYSFPPFSINEVGKRVGPNRREVGHGTLAEKALLAVLPPEDDFPYTVRVNSEVMASDGSTSMASVCGGSMALMDAGIPVREHVAGISVGLISDTDPSTGSIRDYRILTDLLGLEDHLGDMDFKVAGTRKGISAIQLDVKPAGIPLDIICESLDHARRGRIQILDYMDQIISAPRTQNDLTGPRLATLKYSNESIRRLLGPLGLKKRIEQETGARIFVGDESLSIIAKNQDIMDKVLEKVDFVIGREIEVGSVYKGIITSIKEYGAFVEFSGGRHGLLHISELSHGPVSKVSDVVSVGEQVSVMCSGMDVRGNIKLSLKALLPRPEPEADPKITPISSKEPLEVCASVDGANADITAYESDSCRSEVDASDDTPEVLIRSADECDDPDITFEKGALNSAGENMEPSCGSSGTSPMHHRGRVAHMFSDLFSSKRFSAANGKSRTMEPTLDACESKHSLLGGTKQDGSMGIATPVPSSCVKLGDRYTAKVHRIHLHGMVLDLGGGLLGMYKFQENIKRNFTIGMTLEVKCSSFSSKGIPIMTLPED